LRARVHRKYVTEPPFYIKDIRALVLYDDEDRPLFAFYNDLGGLIKYAFVEDSDFEEIVRLAAGYTPADTPEISNLNLSNVENPGPLR